MHGASAPLKTGRRWFDSILGHEEGAVVQRDDACLADKKQGFDSPHLHERCARSSAVERWFDIPEIAGSNPAGRTMGGPPRRSSGHSVSSGLPLSWGRSANGSTLVSHTRGRGSIPRDSTRMGRALGCSTALQAELSEFDSPSVHQAIKVTAASARCTGNAEGSVRPRVMALISTKCYAPAPRMGYNATNVVSEGSSPSSSTRVP